MLTEREMNTKVCSKCREVKLLSEFSKQRASKDGCQFNCKVCTKIYRAGYLAANLEKLKEYNANYRAANPEKCKARVAKWWAAHPDYKAEYSAEYRAANPEKERERHANYRAANPDYQAEYREANPEKGRAYSSNRRAAKSKAIPSWLTKADYKLMEDIGKEAKRIELETGTKMHVDHIHPLRGKLICGLQCPSNLQILTAAQNCSKGNKFTPYVESES